MAGMRLGFVVFAVVLLVAPLVVLAGNDELDAFEDRMEELGERDRIKAVNEISARDLDGVGKLLRQVMFRDESDAVRSAAAHALGRRGDSKDLRFLLAALRRLKKHPYVLAGAVNGIAEYREPKTAKEIFEIGRYWMMKAKAPTTAAIRALGKIRSAESVESLIRLYRQTYPSGGAAGPDRDIGVAGPTGDSTAKMLQGYRPYIEEGLSTLTGQDLNELDYWEGWWDEHERGFEPPPANDDPNRSIRLTDVDRGFAVNRPDGDWRWLDEPEPGFTYTAELRKDDEMSARLSVLAYSTLMRSPDNEAEMLDREKEDLTAVFDRIDEQEWDGRGELAGKDVPVQRIEGETKEGYRRLRQLLLVTKERLFLVRVTLDRWATSREREEADEFVESFTLLD